MEVPRGSRTSHGVLNVNLVPSAQGIGAAIARELGGPVSDAADAAGKDAGKRLGSGLLGGLSDTGKRVLEALGLIAVGVAAFKAAEDVEAANNIIARSTGATGKALDSLQESFQNVASTSGASFETIATTLAQLSQRTGLTGKALETLTSQVVTFNRISADAPITVQSLTQALAGFNVPGKEMGRVLDELFKISQRTGVPLAELLTTLQTAGPIARQFGFSVEFTATLLAQLNKAGLDAAQIMPGLRTAFVNFAKAGKEPAEGLRETLDAIDALIKAGDTAGARQLAVQIFGARGAGLVDAAIAGKLSLDKLGTSVSLLGPGILETAGKTGTLSGALANLRNITRLALAEFATPAIEAANEALRAILPTIRSIGQEFAGLPDPIKVSVAGVIGLVALAGPLGQFGQGVSGLQTVISGIGDGFQLAAVRGLELVESLKAVTLTGALMSGALTLGLAAIAAGLVVIFTASERLAPGLKAAEDQGKRFATTFVVGAQKSANELKTLNDGLKNLDLAQKNITTGEFAEVLASGSQQLINESEGAKAAQIELRSLGTQHDVLISAKKKLVQQQEEQQASDQATKRSLDEYVAALAKGASETDAFADLTEEGKKAVQDFESTLLAAAGGEIGHQQQIINIAKAQQEYNDAVRDFGAESPEAIEKQLALQQAQLQGAASTDELDAQTKDLMVSLRDIPGFYDAEIARLQEQIRLHPESAAGYQLEIDKLVTTKERLDAINGYVAFAQVQVDISDALANMQTLTDALNRVGFSSIAELNAQAQRALHPTAEGGIFSAPQVRLFAEAGPEAVLPLSDRQRSFDILRETGLFDNMPAPVAVMSGGGFHIGTAVFGDTSPIPDLDYFTRTRMAAS